MNPDPRDGREAGQDQEKGRAQGQGGDRPSAGPGRKDDGDRYLDAVHEVSESERGARRERAEALDPDRGTPVVKPAAGAGTGAGGPKAGGREDESADPVGDGHTDADYAKKLPEDEPGGSRTRGGR